MVTFLSVFLGLVLGVHPVELAVNDDVVTVELLLDGRTVGHIEGPPWVLACDFGPQLSPHQLVAIAYDDRGQELSRASLLINQPQPRSRIELVQEDPKSRRVGLIWHSADRSAPDGWRLRFGGEDLDVADPRDFELPPFDAEIPHLFQAALLFGRHTVRLEKIIGGPAGDQIDTDLTAFIVATEDGEMPSLEEMTGWLRKHGEELEIVSVERGGSDIVVVQEATPRLWGALNRLRGDAMKTRHRNFINSRLTSGLHAGDRLRVILPVGERSARAALEQFHISHDFASIERGPTSVGIGRRQVADAEAEGLLATFPYPPEGALRGDAPRRTADAVAVAAQAASAARRTRAVVLIRDPATEDLSEHSPVLVRRYLDRLQVPLVVWSTNQKGKRAGDGPGRGEWGEARDIATFQKLQRAVIELREVLDRQWVIWLRGRHLPHEIELSAAAAARFEALGPGAGTEEQSLGDTDFTPWLVESDRIPKAPAGAPQGQPPAGVAEPDLAQIAPAPREPSGGSELDVGEVELDASAEVASFVEAVDVRLVQVQVLVSDRQDQPVRDLSAADFELYVDGASVEITHFGPPPIPESQELDEPVADEPAAAATGEKRLIIFFDGLRLGVAERRDLMTALREVLAEGTPPSTMVVTYDRTLRIPLAFSSDPGELADLLNRLDGGDLVMAAERDLRNDLAQEISKVENALLQARTALETRMAESRRDALLVRLRSETQVLAAETRGTVDVLQDLISGLGALEGQKVLLYAGAGLELTPVQELYDEAAETLQLNEREASTLLSESSSFRLNRQFDRLAEKANASGVAFHSVVPPTRHAAGVAERSGLSLTRPGAQSRLPSARQESIREGVCLLAGESGGLCQVGGEPRLLLERTLEDLDSTYTLAFSPSHPQDGEFHDLEIKVHRPDLDLRHRPGYASPKEADRLHDRLAAALYFGTREDALGISLEAEEPRPGAEDLVLVPLRVRVPVAGLGFVPLEGGLKLGAEARLLVASRSSSGEVTGVQEFPITFQVESARLERQPALAYEHKVHLMLRPGRHTVAIGLWDSVGEIGSFLSQEISASEADLGS